MCEFKPNFQQPRWPGADQILPECGAGVRGPLPPHRPNRRLIWKVRAYVCIRLPMIIMS